MRMSSIIAAIGSMAIAFAPAVRAEDIWITDTNLCFDQGDNPLSCEDGGVSYAHASFSDTSWSAAYDADVNTICVEAVRDHMHDPNWPLEKISSGCSLHVSQWYPEGVACPSEGFCPRSREEWKSCCSDTRWIGDNLDSWLKFLRDSGAHFALEDLWCGCGVLLPNPRD